MFLPNWALTKKIISVRQGPVTPPTHTVTARAKTIFRDELPVEHGGFLVVAPQFSLGVKFSFNAVQSPSPHILQYLRRLYTQCFQVAHMPINRAGNKAIKKITIKPNGSLNASKT